jgi:hypothetical protein
MMFRILFVLGAAASIGCGPKPEPLTPPALPPMAVTATPPPASTSPLDEAAVPLYPGATKVKLTLGKTTDSGNHTIAAEYSTPDSTDKVVKFYADKLGTQSATPNGKLVQVVGKTPNGGFIQLFVSPNGKLTKIQYFAITPPRQ